MSTLNRALFGSINCVSYGYGETDPYFIVSPTDLDLGFMTDDSSRTGHGLRFLNIDIPTGQVIKNAYISYYAFGDRAGDYCYGHIYGEKSLFPAAFTTWADFEARPKTTNRIPWDKIPHWEHIHLYKTPNIAPIIQEIITQPGWTSGNPIVLFCDDLEDRSTHVWMANRHAWAYYEHYEWTPVLTIEFGPETQIAILDIAYVHFSDFVVITLPTQIPCHLTCFYTHIKPVRHATSRVVRGVALPWGAYWCFVAWHSVEQLEAGDTLTHTFKVHDWTYCLTKWFTFRGTTIDVDSPSVGPLFEHHHSGGLELKTILRPVGKGILCSIPSEIGDPCPDHWKNVDEEVPDEGLTQLSKTPPGWYGMAYDFFTIDPLPAIPLEIYYIRLTARCRREGGLTNYRLVRVGIRTHARTYWQSPWQPTTREWRNYGQNWASNPYTGQPWTNFELNDLQIAIDLQSKYIDFVLEHSLCTQMFLTVHFKPQES